MLTKQGDVKIVDFNLSCTYSTQSRLDTYCGTGYYAAPELLQAKPYIGPEIDVWSAGIVFYVLVCGRVPFDGKTMSELNKKVVEDDVNFPPWLSTGKLLC